MITREQVRDAIAQIESNAIRTISLAAFERMPDPVFFAYQTTIECYRLGLPIEGDWRDLIGNQLYCFGTPRLLADVLASDPVRDRLVANHQD